MIPNSGLGSAGGEERQSRQRCKGGGREHDIKAKKLDGQALLFGNTNLRVTATVIGTTCTTQLHGPAEFG
jgi:hypothetical protein